MVGKKWEWGVEGWGASSRRSVDADVAFRDWEGRLRVVGNELGLEFGVEERDEGRGEGAGETDILIYLGASLIHPREPRARCPHASHCEVESRRRSLTVS